tara:strand:+ start:1304 stop:1444 length:141 start_codon:yes stop_codon:yes gene_type:complete
MTASWGWIFYKEVENKILWVNIYVQDLEGLASRSIKGGRQDIQNKT